MKELAIEAMTMQMQKKQIGIAARPTNAARLTNAVSPMRRSSHRGSAAALLSIVSLTLILPALLAAQESAATSANSATSAQAASTQATTTQAATTQVQAQQTSGTNQPATSEKKTEQQAVQGQLTVEKPTEFDGEWAYEYLKKVCEIGPRTSATEGMIKQQKMLKQHFEELGATVELQDFSARNPFNRQVFSKLQNLIVTWHPERKKRLMICCHYDTRPFPDMDKKNPRGVFIGANDGASGVAFLAELGKHMKDLDGTYGIDFVFFDGEEYVIDRRFDAMFLGSTHFAHQYNNQYPRRYTYAILVDMIADKNLEICFEGNSLGYAPRLTRSIWGVAQELKVKEFSPKQRHMIKDDHLPLNEIARIPTCDIIDFDYPKVDKRLTGGKYWHTTRDVPENCSADSLGKVGKVVLEWLRQMGKLK